MSQELATAEFQPVSNVVELPIASVREAAPETATPALEVRPKSAKEIGDEFGITDRAINNTVQVVLKAYPWLELKTLKIGSGNKVRYTPLCQELIGQYRTSGLSAEDWIASIHAANPDQLPASPAAAPVETTATALRADAQRQAIAPAADVPAESKPETEESIAVVVPQSHIHLLDGTQQSELALIHSLYVKPEPVKTFQSIDLNGDQETILEGLKLLHSTVSQMKSENDRIKADTSKRKSDIELANEAIAAIAQEGKKAVEENFELVAEAQSVQAVETDAKKRLAQLLKALGDV